MSLCSLAFFLRQARPYSLRAKKRATTAPLMLCHTLNIAPGMVARGKAAKWVAARLLASPEFCIPTSMAIALRLGSGMCRSRLAV